MLSIDLSTFDQEKQIGQELLGIDPASLYKELEKVKDRRGKKGKRYSLALILTLILLGKLAGETTIDPIIDCINFRKNDLKKLLNWPKRFPSNKTYSRALACCDDKEVAELLAGVIAKTRGREKCGDKPSKLVVQREDEEEMNHLAADGKILPGTLDHANDAMPSVHIFDSLRL